MSKYKDTSDDCMMICPYCQHSYQVETEDYSEDDRVEECQECGKKYNCRQSFSVSNMASADCELNGELHEWRASSTNKEFEHCETCEACRRKPA